MRRDFERLCHGTFDLLVVGGGIYGAWTAYDAALRGLRVALVERTDWGAGASSASSKLVHGGLRYLESFRLGLVRTSLRERRRLARLGPHQVRPLRFVLPVYRGDRFGRLQLGAGLTIYDLLAGTGGPVGRHRSFGREDLLERVGYLRREGLRGGFTYGDCTMDDARLVVEIVDGAVHAGAIAVNGAEARHLLGGHSRVRGAAVRDAETGETREIEAQVTVNCAGPWAAGLVPAESPSSVPIRLTKGVHLVMPGLPGEHAVLLTARSDGRVFFLIPWYGRTLLGTTDTDYHGRPDDLEVEPDDIAYLLRETSWALDGIEWDESRVLGRFAGLRALQDLERAPPSRATREWTLARPMPGLLVPVGGKYTSARADAAVIVDQAMALLGRSERCATATRPFPWRPEGDFASWLAGAAREGAAAGLDREVAFHCAQRFGARVADLHRLLAERPELAARLHPELPFCRAEVVHAARAEMTRTLQDVVRRRIPLLVLAPREERLLATIADLTAETLGWDGERKRRELRSVMEEPP